MKKSRLTQNRKIFDAYVLPGYTLREIGREVGLHNSIASKVVHWQKGGAEEAQDKALLLFVSAMVSQGDDPSFSVWNRKDGNLPQGKVSISDTFLMPGTDFIYVLGEFMRTVSI